MSVTEAFFICTNCDAIYDVTASHADVGQCVLCQAPMIWWFDMGTLTAWCGCRDWKKGNFVRSRKKIFSAADEAKCVACGTYMKLTLYQDVSALKEAGAHIMTPIPCKRPLTLLGRVFGDGRW